MRVLIADDHDLIRRGLKSLIESKGWTVCAEARNGREAMKWAAAHRPAIAVLDLSMPELNGMDSARHILHVSPQTEVLLLSVHYSDELARAAIAAGVRGFILKSDADRDLLIALENLANHRPFFTSVVTDVILHDLGAKHVEGEKAESDDNHLTAREREVVQLMAEGKSSKEVANSLDISVKTAETHRANIMRKLKIHSVAELVLYAVRNLIIEP